MRSSISSSISSCISVSVLLILLAARPAPACAQDLVVKFDRINNTVSVDATRADIADVVQQLFSQAGAPRTEIDRDVQGRVTLRVRGVTRESALASALNQVDAAYRVEDGVYMIRPNRGGSTSRRGERPGQRDRDEDRSIRAEEIPPAFRKRVDMVADDRPIGEIVRSLARSAGVTINVDRTIPGDLSLDVLAKSETLWSVLQRMAAVGHLKLDVIGPQEVIFRPTPSFTAYYRGRRIGHSSGETFACRNCRFNELKRGWRFCPMCGERIER